MAAEPPFYLLQVPPDQVWTASATAREVKVFRAMPAVLAAKAAVITSLYSDDEIRAALSANGIGYQNLSGKYTLGFTLPANPSTQLLNDLRMSPVLEAARFVGTT